MLIQFLGRWNKNREFHVALNLIKRGIIQIKKYNNVCVMGQSVLMMFNKLRTVNLCTQMMMETTHTCPGFCLFLLLPLRPVSSLMLFPISLVIVDFNSFCQFDAVLTGLGSAAGRGSVSLPLSLSLSLSMDPEPVDTLHTPLRGGGVSLLSLFLSLPLSLFLSPSLALSLSLSLVCSDFLLFMLLLFVKV